MEVETEKLFSGKGDDGSSGLLGKGRFSKSNLRFETLGAIEELSAFLGIVKRSLENEVICLDIVDIQKALYRLMADISYLNTNRDRKMFLEAEDLSSLESRIKDLSFGLAIPDKFLVPGDTATSALVDYARTLSRKAERRAVQLYKKQIPTNPNILPYLNRLSSYLFVLELFLIQKIGGLELSLNQ